MVRALFVRRTSASGPRSARNATGRLRSGLETLVGDLVAAAFAQAVGAGIDRSDRALDLGDGLLVRECERLHDAHAHSEVVTFLAAFESALAGALRLGNTLGVLLQEAGAGDYNSELGLEVGADQVVVRRGHARRLSAAVATRQGSPRQLG